MKNIAIGLLLSGWAGFSGMTAFAGEDVPKASPVKLALKEMDLHRQRRNEGEKQGWGMRTEWTVDGETGWWIDRCQEDRARVTMEDSTGRKAPDVECWCQIMHSYDTMGVSPRNWMPSPHAQWVRVKGEIPFIVSRQEGVTDSVAVKLVKGFSVPVVLKAAGLGKDGRAEDVKATLVVEEYRDLEYGEAVDRAGHKRLDLAIKAEGPLAIRDFDLKTKGGLPMVANRLSFGPRSRGWVIEELKEGELNVQLRYSQHLQEYKAVFDDKVSLAGFVENRDDREPAAVHADRGANPAKGDVVDGMSAIGGTKEAGKAGCAVKAELTGLQAVNRLVSLKADEPSKLRFDVELSIKEPAVFGSGADAAKQPLAVTDSTGRVLEQAVFDLGILNQGNVKGRAVVSIHGESPNLASTGASWVRLKGTLRVPVAMMEESPAYELPLVKNAEQQIPVPGAGDAGGDGHDVAQAGDAPTCRLWLGEVEQEKNHDVVVRVFLEVQGEPLDVDSFELVDEQGVPLKNAESSGSGWGKSDQERSWNQTFKISQGADMKKLRIRLKYRADKETVNVPVDCTVGLGGPMAPQTVGKRL